MSKGIWKIPNILTPYTRFFPTEEHSVKRRKYKSPPTFQSTTLEFFGRKMRGKMLHSNCFHEPSYKRYFTFISRLRLYISGNDPIFSFESIPFGVASNRKTGIYLQISRFAHVLRFWQLIPKKIQRTVPHQISRLSIIKFLIRVEKCVIAALIYMTGHI